jgi:hypothetical protein
VEMADGSVGRDVDDENGGVGKHLKKRKMHDEPNKKVMANLNFFFSCRLSTELLKGKGRQRESSPEHSDSNSSEHEESGRELQRRSEMGNRKRQRKVRIRRSTFDGNIICSIC